MSEGEPRVYLVDDEQPVLTAVSRVLRAAGFRTVVFGSASAFLEAHTDQARGCLVLDLAMPGMGGLEMQGALIERGIRLPIIFLTGRADVPVAVRAMKRGAADFLTKPVDDLVLIEAVNRALERDRDAHRERSELDELRARMNTLTPREREVMAHVVSGLLNKQVASELGAAEKTIKVHRARVMEKMQAESLAELVRMTERLGVGTGEGAGASQAT
ncbi:MAG: response regulator transcription factor [Phycisphaerae bacterium]|jgi:FixJ family two-component response regulator|nr:response regulator transcription factor [Phycisphaerae bacterium]